MFLFVRRREWQMSTAYNFMQLLHQPNSTFFLGNNLIFIVFKVKQIVWSFNTKTNYYFPGDVFDEGQYVTSAEYDEYFQRFQRLFPKTNSDSSLQIVTGNHDVGFHYR